ncbi:hypothetical protein BKN38_07915 [Helicobacter sp. CLO-3]|nr:hypothetical protein BA723_06995 [Helicobacter sp. CLO-3]OHU81959.1 hypothetical protein BKN38_07915 [Helicobacter sp. CLO-3]
MRAGLPAKQSIFAIPKNRKDLDSAINRESIFFNRLLRRFTPRNDDFTTLCIFPSLRGLFKPEAIHFAMPKNRKDLDSATNENPHFFL